jgi:N-acetylmuramoyl-L-alanine amidase
MNIITDLIPAGRKNRPGRSNPMKYITIHNTGNTGKGAGAKNHAGYIKGDSAANALVSWHYTVDEKDIYQHIPDTEDAFHAGDGAGDGNRKSIGIEICMNSDGDLLRATDHAAELAAFLCGKYNIPIENIVQHNHWSGKNCPQMIRVDKPYSWDAFISKVKAILSPPPALPTTPAAPLTPTSDEPSAWAVEAWEWAKASGITDGSNPKGSATREQIACMLYKFNRMVTK